MKFPRISFDSWVRYSGCFLIFLFCVFSIFILQFERISAKNTNVFSHIYNYASLAENWFYDIRSSGLYVSHVVEPDLAVLYIDDESLNKIGRWPWSRRTIAKIIDRMRELGVKSAFFDVLYAEPEPLCVDPRKKSGIFDLTPPDEALATAIKKFQSTQGHIILAFSTTPFKELAAETPMDVLLNDNILSGNLGPNSGEFLGNPYIDKNNFIVPTLANAGAHIGYIDNLPDIDGVFRHASVFTQIDGFLVPSAGLALFQNYFKASPDDQITIGFEPNSISYPYFVSYKKKSDTTFKTMPINNLGEVRVRFVGARDAFFRYSMGDFLTADLSNPQILKKWKDALNGKAVIIGSEAMGAHDLRHTPVEANMPGLYLHANVFHMLNSNKTFKPIESSLNVSILILLGGIIAILFLSQIGAPVIEFFGLFAYLGTVTWIDINLLLPEGYRPALFFIFTGTLGSYIWVNFLNVLREIAERRKIRNAFTRYVSKDIVREVLANPEKLKLGGEKRKITMLFSDIRSFTSISEHLTPQELTLLLNSYMNKMTDILFATKGTLDKYIGDALVAFWGAPVDLPDHPALALEAGVKMLEILPAINEEFKKKKLPTVNIGIGINTGEVSVGNMGSDQIFAYTALGDHMNLASRLEGLTKYYGVGLIVSEFTVNALGKNHNFKIRPLDRVKVKGREEAVLIYEALPSFHPLAKNELSRNLYIKAFDQYLAKDFTTAAENFEKVFADSNDPHAKRLLDSCIELGKTPPTQDWCGIKVFDEK